MKKNRNIKQTTEYRKGTHFVVLNFKHMFEIHSTLTTPTQFQLIKYTLVSIDAFFNAWMLIYDVYSDGISVFYFWF